MKKWLSLVLAMVMVLSLFPVATAESNDILTVKIRGVDYAESASNTTLHLSDLIEMNSPVYPKTPDRSLSRYVWIRSVNTWMKTAAVLSIQNAILSIRCHIEAENIVPDNGVEKIYISPLVSSQYHSKISVIALPMK